VTLSVSGYTLDKPPPAALSDPDACVRWQAVMAQVAAAKALGEIGDSRAVEELLPFLDTEYAALFGTKDTAEKFLNSKNEKLELAAEAWSKKEGLIVGARVDSTWHDVWGGSDKH
jgi:PBS lyase HEAT-like repeat